MKEQIPSFNVANWIELKEWMQGVSKGVISNFWNSEKVSLDIVAANDQCITAIVRRRGVPDWVFTALYASPQQCTRDKLWDYVSRLAHVIHGPWALAGDMNVVTSEAEKTGGAPVDMTKCRKFVECVNAIGLMDLGFTGNSFTWAKGGTSPLQERLDRAICNSEWRLAYPRASVNHLPRIASDHSPIMLSLDDVAVIKPRKFRVQLVHG